MLPYLYALQFDLEFVLPKSGYAVSDAILGSPVVENPVDLRIPQTPQKVILFSESTQLPMRGQELALKKSSPIRINKVV